MISTEDAIIVVIQGVYGSRMRDSNAQIMFPYGPVVVFRFFQHVVHNFLGTPLFHSPE